MADACCGNASRETDSVVNPIGHLGEGVSAYLDGELGTAERREALAHVAGCEVCRQELEDMMMIRARLRSLPMVELPAELGAATPRLRPIYRRPRFVVGAAAAAVAAVLAAATLLAPRDILVSVDDFAQTFGARGSLDTNSPVRVIQPADLNTESESG